MVGLLWLRSCIPIVLTCVCNLISSLKPIYVLMLLYKKICQRNHRSSHVFLPLLLLEPRLFLPNYNPSVEFVPHNEITEYHNSSEW